MNWFETIVVTKKREDIVHLIKRLMIANNKNIDLPDIQLPTESGKLVVLPDFLEEHGEFEDDDGHQEMGEVKFAHANCKLINFKIPLLLFSLDFCFAPKWFD